MKYNKENIEKFNIFCQMEKLIFLFSKYNIEKGIIKK